MDNDKVAHDLTILYLDNARGKYQVDDSILTLVENYQEIFAQIKEAL